jgi:ribosome recycling factor
MVNEALKTLEDKMKASVRAFHNDLATIRTGHASPALVEHIRADYAGVPTPLIQLAGISAPEASLLVIQPWDKSSIHAIEKAILKSDLGINPSNDGNVIRLTIPPLSEERRKDLIKIVHRKMEERKIILRNMRHDTQTAIKKMGEKDRAISQDEEKRALNQLQKITDLYVAEIDKLGAAKERELLEL